MLYVYEKIFPRNGIKIKKIISKIKFFYVSRYLLNYILKKQNEITNKKNFNV